MKLKKLPVLLCVVLLFLFVSSSVMAAEHVHSYSTEWSVDNKYHYHKCTDPNCPSQSDAYNLTKEKHSGGTPATCEDKAVCGICFKEYGGLGKHSYSETDICFYCGLYKYVNATYMKNDGSGEVYVVPVERNTDFYLISDSKEAAGYFQRDGYEFDDYTFDHGDVVNGVILGDVWLKANWIPVIDRIDFELVGYKVGAQVDDIKLKTLPNPADYAVPEKYFGMVPWMFFEEKPDISDPNFMDKVLTGSFEAGKSYWLLFLFCVDMEGGFYVNGYSMPTKTEGFSLTNGYLQREAIFMGEGGVMLFQLNPLTPIVNPFTDVHETDYFFDPVMWAVQNGVTTGMTATTFGPEAGCTRAHAVTFLWRAMGCPEPGSSAMPFKDVEKGSYYEKAVQWAVEEGITAGTSATTFSPDANCERGQIVTFLWRLAGEPNPASSAMPFTDVRSGDYFCKAVQWAVEEGITNGMSATSFAPAAQCTRGQIVTFLYRYMTN